MISIKEKLRDDRKKVRETLKQSIICLYKFCFWWTIILLLMTISEFLHLKLLGHALKLTPSMANAYIALLAAYAASKEVGRWTRTPKTERMGELFVYLWWTLLLIMFSAQFLFPTSYKLPLEMMTICLQILGIFFGSEASKLIHSKIHPVSTESKSS